MKHTKEPWSRDPKRPLVIVGNCTLAVVDGDGSNAMENAQRIVECVNSCAGIAAPADAITAAREALERSRNWLASYPGGGALPALDQVCAALALLKGVGA